jgi:hypothetical protein
MRTAEWAAGLFEGEGSFFVVHPVDHKGGHPYTYARAVLTMTDEDEVRAFHEIVGVGTVSNVSIENHPTSKKPQFRWQAATYASVKHVILLLEPWLGQRRLVQAINALAADTRKVSYGES